MAQKILNDLFNLKITPEKIIEWLTTDNLNDIQWIDLNKNCPREEFIIYFLNYIQDQFTKILQSNIIFKQTPVKKILAQSQAVNIGKLNTNSELLKDNQTISNNNEIKNQTECKVSSKQNIISIACKSSENEKKHLDFKNVKYTPIGLIKHNASTGVENAIVNSNPILSIMTSETITPITKDKNSYKNKVALINCNLTQINQIKSVLMENFDKKFTNMTDDGIISIDNTSFPSLGENSSNSLNVSNFSENFEKNEFLESSNSNFSVSNIILQNSVSLENSLSTLSPINMSISENKCSLVNSSTPEKNLDMSKNFKTTPRQSICLGDFIGTEIRCIKKGSGKKYNSKIISKHGEQKHNDRNRILCDSSFKCSESCRRRRKVNPTRLHDVGEKANKENTIFGIVSRPFAQNPQFVNVSPIDKSIDNASFQVERGLVKKERERKPEIIINTKTEVNTNITDKQNLSCTLSRVPYKIKKLHSSIIPDKILVQSMEVLDVLAVLYSRFLDYNLVMNPMTELYFIILLITTQYKSKVTTLSSTLSKINKKVQSDDVDISNDSNDVQNNLFVLRKSLNFDDIKEKNYENSEYENVNNQKCNPSDMFEYYNLTDDIKKDLNEVNKEFKKIPVHISCNKQILDIKEENNVQELNNTKNYVKKYLNNPHNCVYFSTQVLYHQKSFLECLDRVTLKLLCENNQIATFQPELSKHLNKIYSIKVTESNQLKSILNIRTVDLNVSFQIDTDNREKFPSAIAFQCFRKQRDMFYEILKIWEDNHLLSGWKFQIALSGKIRTMLTMHTDVTNFTHFTRLFKSQMLISCIQNEQQHNLIDNETLSILKNLKDNNPDKLTKLQRKLVTPVFQNGPVPLPSFPGIQEFYKDFILYSSHPMFYTYLENTFIYEIMELNVSYFSGSDIEQTETEVDERTKQNFIVCLSSLRLLSKFLGYITSLPYRSETSMLEDVISSQIILRAKCLPHIDLQYCLQIAVIEGKLSLTVPWIVEYLGMMDHATLRLPYYKRVLEILYCIYRASNYDTAMNLDYMSKKTAVLIKFTIGWLFELPIFPKEFYYLWQSKYSNKTLKIIREMQQPIPQFEYSFVHNEASSVKHCLFLDKLEMIDERILYNCCPFLSELNILLTSGNSNLNNSASCRHITPVTCQLQNPVKTVNTKYLEIQLEEAFFHGQPMSTRKTVEYVSERVASSCIKYIYNNLLTMEKKINFEALKNVYNENYTKTLEINCKSIQTALRNDMDLLSAKASKNVKQKCEQIIPQICESRITQSIESLLSEDCLQPVKNMCSKIAMRTAMERINQWIQLHIVDDTIFMKDMDAELNKILKPYDEIIVDKNLHNPDAASPTNVLDEMRNLICNLIETKGSSITTEILFKFCDRLYESLTERSDLKYISETTISSLSVDLCLFLISYRNDLFTEEIQEKVFKVWKISNLKFSEPDSPLSRILSPRNIILMVQSDNNKVWINCGKFLNRLLKKNLLLIDTLSNQAIALFRNEWTVKIAKKLSICLNESIKSLRSLDEETERIKYLLEWVAGTYNDMDYESFRFY